DVPTTLLPALSLHDALPISCAGTGGWLTSVHADAAWRPAWTSARGAREGQRDRPYLLLIARGGQGGVLQRTKPSSGGDPALYSQPYRARSEEHTSELQSRENLV